MKRLVRALPALLLCLAAGRVHAQVSGQYTGADVLPPNTHLFGAYLDVSDSVVGLMAQLRLSFYPGVDFGFQGGPSRVTIDNSDIGTVRVGGDFKVAVHRSNPSAPFDVSAGACLGLETGDNYSLLSLGPTLALSRTFRPGQAGGVTPYASLTLLYTNVDVRDQSNTDFSAPLRLGADFIAAPSLHLVGEVQFRIGDDFRDHTVFNVGVNSPF